MPDPRSPGPGSWKDSGDIGHEPVDRSAERTAGPIAGYRLLRCGHPGCDVVVARRPAGDGDGDGDGDTICRVRPS